jgi:hypothetical protein
MVALGFSLEKHKPAKQQSQSVLREEKLGGDP